MQSKIILNQRFQKSVNDIETILNEFKRLMEQGKTTDDLVRVQLLGNELKTATNSVLEAVEDTSGENAATILIEMSLSDLETFRNLISAEIHVNSSIDLDNGPSKIILEANSDSAYDLLSEFVSIIRELKGNQFDVCD